MHSNSHTLFDMVYKFYCMVISNGGGTRCVHDELGVCVALKKKGGCYISPSRPRDWSRVALNTTRVLYCTVLYYFIKFYGQLGKKKVFTRE